VKIDSVVIKPDSFSLALGFRYPASGWNVLAFGDSSHWKKAGGNPGFPIPAMDSVVMTNFGVDPCFCEVKRSAIAAKNSQAYVLNGIFFSNVNKDTVCFIVQEVSTPVVVPVQPRRSVGSSSGRVNFATVNSLGQVMARAVPDKGFLPAGVYLKQENARAAVSEKGR
jgi:hypothetical protein